MLRKSAMLVLVAGSLLMSACNTVKGAGRDLESASDATKDAVNK